jgi:haloalkane dehalogenase
MRPIRPSWVDDDLFPFTSRFVDIEGHSVHYVDEGEGPLLLMLHGNPTWSFVYRQVISGLCDSYRCVALDYPGFGLSSAREGYDLTPLSHAEVTEAFVTSLDLHEVTAVVQDWGGPIGARVIARQRERFRAIVVANTWAWPVNGDLHFEWFSHMMGDWAGQQLILRYNLFVNALIPAGHRRRKLSASEMKHYREALPSPARRRASAVLPRAITRNDGFLAEVERSLTRLAGLPALILWADRDIAFRAKERERWERLLAQPTVHILRGAGHFVQSDAADEFTERLRSWLETVDASHART